MVCCINHIQTLRLILPPRALIKAASPADEGAKNCLDRQVHPYRLSRVASAECFRKMYDVIDDSTIALEWLDTTLSDMKYQPEMRTYSLIMTVLRAALISCLVLESYKGVNTGRVSDLTKICHPLIIPDYKPANILLSGVGTSLVTAKVGDLGLGEQVLIDETRFC